MAEHPAADHLRSAQTGTRGSTADHDRRVEARLASIACEIGAEGERTRAEATRQELETRLYLRDREDRTEDLVRTLADRNLVEMQNFERRSRDDEDATRALIRHETERRDSRDFQAGLARETRLVTKIDILEAECHRRGRWDGGRGDRDSINFNPHINVHVDDEALSASSARARNTSVGTGVGTGVGV